MKNNYSDCQIDYIIYDYAKGVVEANPCIDNIIEITDKERKSKIEFFKFLLKLDKYDICINAQGKVEGLLVMLFSRAKVKIGYDKKFWRIFNTYSIDPKKERIISGIGTTVDDRLALLKPLNLEKLITEYKIWISEQEKEKARKKLLKNGINFEKPVLMFGVTSRRKYRIWPQAFFAEVIDHLIEKYEAQIIMFFAPINEKYNNEEDYCNSLKKLTSHPENVFTNIRTENIRELISLLSVSDLYVGNDNGPRHFSQGVNTPTFCIFSPTANKWDFAPHESKMFVSIDLQDALELNNKNYKKSIIKLDRNKNNSEYFRKIKPHFVKDRMDLMIKNNSLWH